jgi:serine acetyltransferase
MPIPRSGQLYTRLRQARSRLILAAKRLRDVDRTAYIHPTATVARDLQAAEYVFVGQRCAVPPRVSIGRYSMLAAHAAIVGDDHNWTEPGVPIQFSGRPEQRDTWIGKDVWIGRGATLISGVRIGDGSIIAAGSVVTKDVPPFEVWAGVPARRIRLRFGDEQDRARHRVAVDGALLQPQFVARRRPSSSPVPRVGEGPGRHRDRDHAGQFAK